MAIVINCSEGSAHLPTSLRQKLLRCAHPAVRLDHLHCLAVWHLRVDGTVLVLAERRGGRGIVGEVAASHRDKAVEVIDTKNSAAGLDQRVEDAAKVAGAGTCE